MRSCPPSRASPTVRGANQPATITRPSTSGSTNIPTATGLGERTIRYSPIKATIHDSTMTDSNAVVTSTSGFLSARLARNAVWTSQPSAIKPAARYQRTALRTTNRASSASRARPYVPAKQRTDNRSITSTLPAQFPLAG